MTLYDELDCDVTPSGLITRPDGLHDLMSDLKRGHHAAEVVRDLQEAYPQKDSMVIELEDPGDEFIAALAQLHEREIVSKLARADDITLASSRMAADSPVGKLTVESVHSELDFAAWALAEGTLDCWEDDDFLHYQDKTTGCRVRRSQCRNSIIVPATRWTKLPKAS